MVCRTVVPDRVPAALHELRAHQGIHNRRQRSAPHLHVARQTRTEEYLSEYGLSQNRLARAIGISPNRVADIVGNRRRITADTAVRLSLYFGNSAEYWLSLQANYDLKIARGNLSAEDAAQIKGQRAA